MNYIPFSSFMNTTAYLIFRFSVYVLLVFFVIFMKHKYKIEVEKPHQELHYFSLLPLLVPCFTELIYCIIIDAETNPNFNGLVLSAEIVIDLLDSIFEDIIFVDVMIALLFDIFSYKVGRNLFTMVLASIIFTVIRSYVFISRGLVYGGFTLLITFVVTFTCCYLAIYFDSPLIPIFFHFLFNVSNFVIAPHVFTYDIELNYYMMNIFCLVFLMLYTNLLLAISYRLNKKHHLWKKERLS